MAAFETHFENHQAGSAIIHESCYVDLPCRIGENTSVLHFSHIAAHAIIGDNCFIGHNVTIATGVFIGNDVRVMNNATLNSGLIMEDSVYCGASTVFTDNREVRKNGAYVSAVSPTLIRRGAHIGANTTVASGHTIGESSFIEAGSVIDRNIPDFAVVFGNPITISGWQCHCGHSLKFKDSEEERCSNCGKTYHQKAKWKIVKVDAPGKDAARHDSHSRSHPPVRDAKRAN